MDIKKIINKNLKDYNKMGIEEVEILVESDACFICKKNAGIYPIDKVPIIPCPDCTRPVKLTGKSKKWCDKNANKQGGWCRCDILPVIPKEYKPSSEFIQKYKESKSAKVQKKNYSLKEIINDFVKKLIGK